LSVGKTPGKNARRWRVGVPIRGALIVSTAALVLASCGLAPVVNGKTTLPNLPQVAAASELVPGSYDLLAVACPSATTCVAVGETHPGGQGVVVAVTGGTAGRLQIVADTFRLDGVACATATTCEAVGDGDLYGTGAVAVAVVDGVAGVAQAVQGFVELAGIACPGPTMCIAVGPTASIHAGVVNIANGVPGPLMAVGGVAGLAGVSCASPTTCAAQQATGVVDLDAVACATVSACEAVGTTNTEGVVLPITDGRPGAAQAVPNTYSLDGVACPTALLCQAVGQSPPSGAGLIVTITNGMLGPIRAVLDTRHLDAVACPTPTICEAVGLSSADLGAIVPLADGVPGATRGVPTVGSASGGATRSTGAGATLPVGHAYGLTAFLDGVACPTPTRCETVGGDMFLGGPGEIAVLSAVQAPSATVPPANPKTDIVLAPARPSVLADLALQAVACRSETDCQAVGYDLQTSPYVGVVVPAGGDRPGLPQVVPGAGQLAGVACPSASVCVTAGIGYNGDALVGEVATITNGVAAPARPTMADDLSALACPTAASCTAVGDDLGNPAVVPVTDGAPGTMQVVAGLAGSGFILYGVACPTVNLCVAVGDDHLSGSGDTGLVVSIVNGVPGVAQLVAGLRSLAAVACSGINDCVAVGTSTSYQGALIRILQSVPGMVQSVRGAVQLAGVSCPSAARCVAVGQDGDHGVVVSITNGAPGPAHLVAGSTTLAALSCPSVTTCEAVGSSGGTTSMFQLSI